MTVAAPPTQQQLAEQYAASLVWRDGLLLPTYRISWGELTPRQIERTKRVGWRIAATREGLSWE